MNDFRKTLETLTPSDVSFLHPIPTTDAPASVLPRERKRRPRRETETPTSDVADLASLSPPPEKAPVPERPSEPILPVYIPPGDRANRHEPSPPRGAATDDVPAKPDNAPPQRRRTTVDHAWPPVGTRLVADYFGTVYHAEVVPAEKRLKSGRQLVLLDGPAQGKRLDSFSKAMLVATAKQRKTMNLGRRGTSNGWEFWVATTPGSPPERSP